MSRYYVFNKQYSKAAYEELVERIISHMVGTGEWGEFFPVRYSLFGYNETLANDYYPLTEAAVRELGWKWHVGDERTGGVPDKSDDVLTCEISGRSFRVIPQELKFYKKFGIPLPRVHPEVRNSLRVGMRAARVLRDSTCGKCGKVLKTAYSGVGDGVRGGVGGGNVGEGVRGGGVVYCEECYLREVY